MKTIALLSALLFTACSTTWSRPEGLTEREFIRDDYECRLATAHVQGVGPDLRDYKWWLYDRCMMARGYVKQ